MRVLGVDPGISNLGLVVLEGERSGAQLVHAQVVTTSPKEPATKRVGRLFQAITQTISEHAPEAVALEAQYFYRQNERAFQVGWAVGALLAAAEGAGLSVYAYGPMQIKKALVGYGRAEKEQVAFMVRALLGLSRPLSPSHVADAAAVALAHLFYPPHAHQQFRL